MIGVFDVPYANLKSTHPNGQLVWFDVGQVRDFHPVTVMDATEIPGHNSYFIDNVNPYRVSAQSLLVTSPNTPDDFIFLEKFTQELLEEKKILFVYAKGNEQPFDFYLKGEGKQLRPIMGLKGSRKIFSRFALHVAKVNGIETVKVVADRGLFDVIVDEKGVFRSFNMTQIIEKFL